MTIPVASTGETRSAGSKKYRNARKKPHTASARPTKCNAARATPTDSGRPPSWGPNGQFCEMWMKSAPYMFRMPPTVAWTWSGRNCSIGHPGRQHRGDLVSVQGADQPHG